MTVANIFSSVKQWPQKFRDFIFYQLLHADDPPHRVALGVAIGMFVAFTPTVGFQMVLVIFFAWILRANRAAGLPVVWISNPATMLPIFYGTYWVGRVILRQPHKGDAWWERLYSPPPGWWPTVKFYWTEFAEIAAPLWLGSIIVALALAVPSYLVTYYGIRSYRLKRWGTLTPPPSVRKAKKKNNNGGNDSNLTSRPASDAKTSSSLPVQANDEKKTAGDVPEKSQSTPADAESPGVEDGGSITP